jgi:hypothetical protein
LPSPISCSKAASVRSCVGVEADLQVGLAGLKAGLYKYPHHWNQVRLKKHYTSREVAAMTGLTARQLQWWDARRLFTPAIAPRRTEAGGFTERRYTPMDVLELQVLADLRRRRFSIARLRRLLATLRDVFRVRLY